MAALEIINTPLYTDPSIIAYWRFQGNSNASIGGFNGTDSGISYSDSYGKFGNGFKATDSTGNKIAFGSKIIPAGAKTISFWYKKIGTSTNSQQLLDTNAQNGANNGTYIIADTAGANLGWVEGPNLFSIGTNPPDTNMNLYTFTWDGTTGANKAIIYVNGVSTVTGTASSATQAAGYKNLDVGGLTGYTYPMISYMDDLAIFSRALSAGEVLKLYTGNWSSARIINFI